MAGPFIVYDCSLVTQATGHSVSSLRELLHAVREIDRRVLEHHMMRCQLSDRFELDEFPNEFARWCWADLGDHVTGERLGMIDPFRHASPESLRAEIVEVLEDRLWLAERHVVSAPPGAEFHLLASQLVAYDIGVRLETVGALVDALPRMSPRSLYYHIHEARRRTHGKTDDFSEWLETAQEAPAGLVQTIREIDFYFLNLTQLRDALLEAVREFFPEYQSNAGGES